ncbi:FAD:protein FMN transferase [Microvirga sp. SRT01]|uniref:FAD:protein FMN transferase n=1 Tax=Sphingomonas longa TaxID=2778730 RepID=A0ABS2D8J7_9SPHN|nr:MULTISPECIES: FAD:protein FMN transferase [Alphaproteobacteria]MBM6577235.1 FAD:protein FMN transferase [Sphingomonas sp. BT552]MBR7710279.1 FAD:protein FMN transferase [Microvirga sp. SRT01]
MTPTAPPTLTSTGIACFFAMGTRVELHRFGPGDEDALMLAQRAIEAVDDALTIHRPSAATALNEALLAGREVAVDDPVLFDALIEIDAAQGLTLGLFDPTADAQRATGWRDVRIDAVARRVAVTRPVALDFGGFGKGFALDRAAAALRAAGVSSALLSAGESSIVVVGEHPLGGGWPFAIPDPLRPERELVEVELNDEAMSISSTVGAGTLAPDRAAMIRPGDASVVSAARCAVVIDRSGSHAEMLSTALIVAADDEVARLTGGARRFLFDLAPVESARMCV